VKYNTIFFAFFFLFITPHVTAQKKQKIVVDVVEQPLNRIFLSLRDVYGFRFAYDEDYISKFSVSLSGEFDSKEDAIRHLISGLPLRYEKSGDVFMIIPDRGLKKDSLSFPEIEGQILEANTYEPLPYSNITINGQPLTSDQKGHFSFIASTDTSFALQISHLGYYLYDTVLFNSVNQQFFLNPSVQEIGQVLVKRYQVEKSALVGEKPGKMKLNHVIASYLPGYGDNSVYAILRLMPGILASGEQSSDLLIWGSYEGQSRVQFDGFTLFGLKNFNDNIGAVNPLMVKNIEIYKGGYEAKNGGRVGALLNIMGINGQMAKPAITFCINNSTVNSLVEIPFLKKSSIVAAFRKTYYELYDPAKLNMLGPARRYRMDAGEQSNMNNSNLGMRNTLIGLIGQPEYNFMDANLKYTYRGGNGELFYLSLYGGGDNFLYDVRGDYLNVNLIRQEKEWNRQNGASAYWGKTWGKGVSGNVTIAYSNLNNSTSEENGFVNLHTQKEQIKKLIKVENDVSEYSFRSENSIPLLNGHSLDVGFGYVLNNIKLERKSFADYLINMDFRSERAYVYLQDYLPVGGIVELKTGLRMDYSASLSRFYVEPRVSASVKAGENWKVNAAWGIYNQFIAKTAIVDSVANYAYFWTAANNGNIPVLRSRHLVGGLTYDNNNFTVSIEGYHKTVDGLTRYVSGTKRIRKGYYSGDGRSYGIDVFIKKSFKENMAWLAYSLSRSEERFPFNRGRGYRPALHDQRHELKLAGILNIKSFYISANYVFGSGFERATATLDNVSADLPVYSRFDAAVVYRFAPKKFNMEAGVSVLNVFNHENIKYSNLKRVQTRDRSFVDVYSEAVPFSPMLFLKIKL